MKLYLFKVEDSKPNAKKKSLKLRNEFSKVMDYNINTQSLTVFLYSGNGQSKNELGKTT